MFKALEKEFSDRPITKLPEVVRKEIWVNGTGRYYAQSLLFECQRIMPVAVTEVFPDLNVESLTSYFSSLVVLRINYCKGILKQDDRQMYRRLAVPTLLYQVLIGIGEVTDPMYNIQIIPENPEGVQILSPDDMVKISGYLNVLSGNGFKLVVGLPEGRNGILDFMAMDVDGESVTSYRASHPVYGFLASFVEWLGSTNDITKPMSRILYGYVSDYRIRIPSLIMIGGTDNGISNNHSKFRGSGSGKSKKSKKETNRTSEVVDQPPNDSSI